jgi:hypothetical protein
MGCVFYPFVKTSGGTKAKNDTVNSGVDLAFEPFAKTIRVGTSDMLIESDNTVSAGQTPQHFIFTATMNNFYGQSS